MELTPTPSSGASQEESKTWSFLPYEEERETPRRELLFLKAVHAIVIPLADAISILAALIASYFITEAWMESGTTFLIGERLGEFNNSILKIGIATIPIWLVVFIFFGVYKREIRRIAVSTFDELPSTWGALAIGAWLSVTFMRLTIGGEIYFKTIWVFIAITWVLLLLMVPFARAVIRIGLSFHNPFRTSALVVGSGEVGSSLVGRLGRHKEYGLRVVGFLDANESRDAGSDAGVQLLGRPSDLRAIVDRYGISRVLIAFSAMPYQKMLEIIHECQEMKIDVSIVPRFFEAQSSNVEIEDVEGLTMASLPRYARHGLIRRAVKRLMDIVLASLAMLVLSPILLLIAVLIKLDSRGPVFFMQERTGKNHRRFVVYKFRSMRVDAESMRDELAEKSDATGPIFKMKQDPRITRVGRMIRRLSIDELPQLINVIKGEMSLVGPRPLPVMEAEKCTGTADMRHLVQPGITGLWQVLGRSDIPYEEMMQLDYIYVTNWTLRWDIKIILRTLIVILRKRGAY